MPTVLTSVATSAAPPRVLRSDRTAFGLLLAAALTPLSLLILGYHPFAEDGGLYLAGVKYLLNPALFPFSRAFVTAPLQYSAFAPSLALFIRSSGIPFDAAILTIFLLCLWATIFASWSIARLCFAEASEQIGATLLVALWLSLPVAGTSLMLIDPYLTARSVSTPCVLLALAGAIAALQSRDRSSRASLLRHSAWVLLWLAVAAAFHPLMAGYGIAFTVSVLWLEISSRRSRLIPAAFVVLGALLLAGAVQSLARPDTALFTRVALTRSYWFLRRWEWFEILGLVAPLLFLAFSLRLRRFANARALAATSLTVGLAAILVALCFAREAVHPLAVAHLQPLRVFQTIYFLLFLGLGGWLGRSLLGGRRWRWVGAIGGRRWRWVGAILVLGLPVMLPSTLVYPHSAHLELPGVRQTERNPWVAAFHWIRGNTPVNALFALDANYITEPDEDAQSFRAIAERSTLPDYSKDGGETAVNPALSPLWSVGVDATRSLSTMNADTRVRTLAPLGVSWIVLRSAAESVGACPYDNDVIKVCKLQ